MRIIKEKIGVILSMDEKNLSIPSKIVLAAMAGITIILLYLLATYKLSSTEFVDDILKFFTIIVIIPVIILIGVIFIVEKEGKKQING